MTENNYAYRTSPFFLRNQFEAIGKYDIPSVPKPKMSASDFDELRLIGFDKIKSNEGKHPHRIVHFFLYDYKFERAWESPDADLEALRNYRAVLTPDFSMYTEMPEAMLLYNVFRNRWCGAYFASQGLRVIPTVNFGLPNSFDFCFEGIEKGSTVALSTYMVQEKDGREAQRDFFMAGYNEMLRRIEPAAIICYHEPFPDMTGNIIYVNYDLSSWQHVDDDVVVGEPEKGHSPAHSIRIVKHGGYVIHDQSNMIPLNDRIVKTSGYVVQLGAGSAYGGNWMPKNPEAERFLGKVAEIKTTYDKGYRVDTKIGENGRATVERHYTDHGKPWAHSNPHDHYIKWDSPDAHPEVQGPTSYQGDIPEFKNYKGVSNMPVYSYKNSPEDNQFKTIAEFQQSIRWGAEIVFEYENKTYSITRENEKINISEAYKQETEANYDNSEDLLNHMIEGKKLREIITEVEVFDRTI